MIRGKSKDTQDQKEQDRIITKKVEAIKALLNEVKLKDTERSKIAKIIAKQTTTEDRDRKKTELTQQKIKEEQERQLDNLYTAFSISSFLTPEIKFKLLGEMLKKFMTDHLNDGRIMPLLNDKYQANNDIYQQKINDIYQQIIDTHADVNSLRQNAPTDEDEDENRKTRGDETNTTTPIEGKTNATKLTSGSGGEPEPEPEGGEVVPPIETKIENGVPTPPPPSGDGVLTPSGDGTNATPPSGGGDGSGDETKTENRVPTPPPPSGNGNGNGNGGGGGDGSGDETKTENGVPKTPIGTLSETTSPTVIGGGGGGATPPSGRGGGGEMKLEEVRKKAAAAEARDELLLRSQLVSCYNEKEKIKNTQFDSRFDSMKNEWENEEKVQEWSSSLETIVKNQRPKISDEIYNKIFTTDLKQKSKNILIRDAIAADLAKKIADKVPFFSSDEEKKAAKDRYKNLIKPVKEVSDLLLLAIKNEVEKGGFRLDQPIFSEISDITYKQAFKILTGKEKSKDIVKELRELGSGQIADDDDDRSEISEFDEPDEEIYQKLGDNESFAKEVKAFEATLNGQRQEHFYQELVKKAKDVELVEKAKDVISNKFSVITEFIDLQSRTVSKDDKDDKYELLESLLNKDKNQVIDDNVIKDAIIWHLLNNNEEAYGVLISHGKTLEVKLGGQKIISQYTEEEIEDKPNTIKEFIKGNQSDKNKFVNEIILLSKANKTSRQNDFDYLNAENLSKLSSSEQLGSHLTKTSSPLSFSKKEATGDAGAVNSQVLQRGIPPILEATSEEEEKEGSIADPNVVTRRLQLSSLIPKAREEEKDDTVSASEVIIGSYEAEVETNSNLHSDSENKTNTQPQNPNQDLIKIYGKVLEYVDNKENEHPTGKDLKELKAVFSNKENHITIPRETKRGMPKRDVEYTKHLVDFLDKQKTEHTQALKELKELKQLKQLEIKQELHEELEQKLQQKLQQKQQGEPQQELQELQELQQERREKLQKLQQERREKLQQQEQREQELNDIVKNIKNTFGVKSSQGLKTVLKKVIEDNYYDNSTQASLLQNFIQEQLEPKIAATKNKESLMSKAGSGALSAGSAVFQAGATVIGAGATVIGAGAGFVTDNPITRGLSTASDTILDRTGIDKPTHPFPRAVAAAIVPSVALGVGTVGVAVGAGAAVGAAVGAGVVGAGLVGATGAIGIAGTAVNVGAGTALAGAGAAVGAGVVGAGAALGAGIAAVGVVASGAEHLVRKASGLKTSPVSPSIIEAGELLIKNTAGRIAPDSIKNNIPSLSVQVREWMTAVDLVKIHKNYRKVEVEEGKSDSVWKGKDRKISFKVHKNVYSEKGDKTDWYEKEENAVNVQTAICLNIINNMVGRNVEEKVNNFVLMYNISKHFGGLSHKFDDKGKVIRDRDGKPELLTVEDVNDNYITKSNLFNKAPIDQNKLEEFQKLSREFQKECKEAGIVSGRDGSEKGLRFTFLSHHVLDKAHTIATSSQFDNTEIITIGQDLSDALDNAKAEMASKKTNKTR